MRLNKSRIPHQDKRIIQQRKRIKSFNTEFKLVPLLRKVSMEPTSSDKSVASCMRKEFTMRKNKQVSFVVDEDESDKNKEDDSVSDDANDNQVIITVGDCSPGH